MAFMGNKAEEDTEETPEENTEETSGKLKSSEQESEMEKSLEKAESPDYLPVAKGIEGFETDKAVITETEETTAQDENKVHEVEEHGEHKESADETITLNSEQGKSDHQLPVVPVDLSESSVHNVENRISVNSAQESETAEVKNPASPESLQPTHINFQEDQVTNSTVEPGESHGVVDVQENFHEKTKQESIEEERLEAEDSVERVSPVHSEVSGDSRERDETKSSVSPPVYDSKERDETKSSVLPSVASEEINSANQSYDEHLSSASPLSPDVVPDTVLHENEPSTSGDEGHRSSNDVETDMKEQQLSSVTNTSDSDAMLELERVKRDVKMMETALQGAARQAQVLFCDACILGSNDSKKLPPVFFCMPILFHLLSAWRNENVMLWSCNC